MSDETNDAGSIETKAREMGWVPKEEFQGAEGKFVEAAEFVERGEHVLPILRKTNERQRAELTDLRQRMAAQEDALRQARETIGALEEYHAEDVKQKVTKAREDLRAQLASASEAGDHASVAALTDKITELNIAERDRAAADKKNPPKGNGADKTVDHTNDPDFVAFKEANPWYGTEVGRTAIAQMISVKLRADGVILQGKPFLDKVVEETNKEVARLAKLAGGGRSFESKVETGGARGSGGSSGRSYSDLPADAKAACDGFESKLVGPGKKYKTTTEWRKAYAERYFTEV